MSDYISIRGLVATQPNHNILESGLDVTSFRLASTTRKLNKETGTWVDSDVNWYTVSCFRALARNAAESIQKGQRVVVSGKLKLREWDNGERSGLSVEVEAQAIGQDLAFGTSEFTRRSYVQNEPEDDEEDSDLERELQPA
jgi:single-strand DNA-binding protein